MVRRTLACVLALMVGLGCGGGDDPKGMDGGRVDGGVPGDDASIADGGDSGDAGRADAGPVCPTAGLAPGDATFDLDYEGNSRAYLIHVPSSYDGTAPVPLVLNFHGFTSNAEQQIVLSGMNDKADAEGFIAVHPQGIGASWNAGDCCGTAATEDLDDVGLVRAIVDDVASRVCIDRARVYATGMSNGGFLSHRLACQLSDVIAAAAPVAGVMGIPDDECTPGRPMPIMDFHGTADIVVPYDGGGVTGFRSVPDTIAGWVARDGCSDTPEITYDTGDTTCETYRGCDGDVEVTLCTSEGEGHWWPGGPASTADIVATDAMWEFFQRYRLP